MTDRMDATDIGMKRFPLSNKGDLDICFIGVGAAFAKTMHQTNFIIVKGNRHILVDFGMTGPRALRESAFLDPSDIELLLPTHSHADHVGGIECLALMNRYVGRRHLKKRKLRMIVTEAYQNTLWDQTLRGGLEWNEMDDNSGQKLDFTDFFDVIRPTWKKKQPREIFEVEMDTGLGTKLKIELFRTKHIPEQSGSWEESFISYGLFIDDRIFISGDTRFDPELVEMYGDRSEAMFHDVQFFPGAVHAPLADIKTLPGKYKSKMMLIHYADNWKEQDITDFAGFAREGQAYRF